jgi:hypothetical protein
LDRDAGADLPVDLDRDVERPQRADRLVQLNLAAVDLDPFGLEQLGDLRARHGAVEGVVLADLLPDHDFDLGDARRQAGRVFGLLRLADDPDFLAELDLPHVPGRRLERQRLGKQEVPRVTGGDVHHLAALSQLVDVFSQYDLHATLPTNPR